MQSLDHDICSEQQIHSTQQKCLVGPNMNLLICEYKLFLELSNLIHKSQPKCLRHLKTERSFGNNTHYFGS
jgi:hypothetical protein